MIGLKIGLINMKKLKRLTKKKILRMQKRQLNKDDKNWRITVKNRDNNECVICKNNITPHVHHIIPRENKLLRHEIMNGITLCAKHHKFSIDISPHRNPFVFMSWLRKNRIEQTTFLLNIIDDNNIY